MTRLSFAEAEVHFSDEGRGRPVLLLHGFPTIHLLWRRVSPALAAAGFRAIAPIGYGSSDAAESVSLDALNQAPTFKRNRRRGGCLT